MKKAIKCVLKSIGLLRVSQNLNHKRNMLFSNIGFMRRVALCRFRYWRHVRRIRHMPKSSKVRVLFIVSEIAKWKEQSLYEAMEASDVFEPIVGISAWNQQDENRCPDNELDEVLLKAESFFDRMKDRHVRTVRTHPREYSDLSEFNPDIVFYTEPWGPGEGQDAESVSSIALTCFLPYYIPAWGNVERNCRLPLHFFLWRFFAQNEIWARYWKKHCHWLTYVPKFIPTGHPALDCFAEFAHKSTDMRDCVIYAPHHSIYVEGARPMPQYISTFKETGHAILAFAQKHPEIKWVFKPHPVMKWRFVDSGYMTLQEVDAYYDAWRKIGAICQDGDYQQLFIESRAMITDSGSFLMEYGATGRPLVRLVSCHDEGFNVDSTREVCDSYYNVHTQQELMDTLELVIVRGEDPKRNVRLKAVSRAALADVDAAKNIVDYLREELRR